MIIGHEKQLKFLKKCAESENLSHAFLFAGQEKLGKKKVALEWISLLFGEDVIEKQHPDLHFVEPINKEIQVSQIRNLIWSLSLKPYSAPLKVAIIDSAHSMNQESQTAILKTLEEPRGRTVIILISEEARRLFPTILSRVQTIKFFPVQKQEIKKYLIDKGVKEKEAEDTAEISQGKPGMAMDYLLNPVKKETFQKRIKELDKLINSNLAFRFEYAKSLSQNHEDLKESLDIWLNYFRNMLMKAVKQPNAHLNKLKKIINDIQRIKLLISTTNVNSRLALETLMIEL